MRARRGTAIVVSAVLFALSRGVRADPSDPVHFNDDNLREAVKDALGTTTDPTESDMLSLTGPGCSYQAITDLTGLEYATNMSDCYLYDNQISGTLTTPAVQDVRLSPWSRGACHEGIEMF